MPEEKTKQKEAEAEKLWDAILWRQMPGLTKKHTAIYKSWLENREVYGAPTSQEYDSTNEEGNPVIRQNFQHARCTWHDGKAHWQVF